MTKRCRICQTQKLDSDFYAYSGFSCKSCIRARVANRYERIYGTQRPPRNNQYHRFTIKERVEYYIEKTESCWTWKGPRNASGYGILRGRDCPSTLAHRTVYEVFVGPIPDGFCVCHHCDNPPCVNPSHLWIGTNIDNVRDMVSKNRQSRVGTNFKKGEERVQSKLVTPQVLQIRERALAGESHRKLAQEFGISNAQVSNIRTGKSWSHV